MELSIVFGKWLQLTPVCLAIVISTFNLLDKYTVRHCLACCCCCHHGSVTVTNDRPVPQSHCKPALCVVGVLVSSFRSSTIDNYSDARESVVEAACGSNITCCFSSLTTCCIEQARRCCISSPRNPSVWEYSHLFMPGASISASMEFKHVNPPPADISPRAVCAHVTPHLILMARSQSS